MPEFSSCPLCASADIKRLFDCGGYPVEERSPVFACRDCTARFLNPQPSDKILEQIYDGRYVLGSGGATENYVKILKRETARLNLQSLRRLSKRSEGRLLEIGCSWGDFLVEAQQAGYRVDGVEISPESAKTARERLGSDCVQTGTIESANLESEAFDFVANFDAIEHVRDPGAVLDEFRRVLKPGGTVMIATPDLDGISSLLLGRYWPEYKNEHLFYFSRKSMRLALERRGFRAIRFESNRKMLNLDYINHHFARYPVPVLSILVGAARAVCPEGLALKRFRIPSGGFLVAAEKV
jgi:2-polyprenyl-3-methyl-5-hydroxy-6-metoxy-1,4-benzoquinol methylase